MIVGTAGHIDHGKTTLVRALTGVDTDRLPEEKKRGISIELGYAFMDLPAADAGAGAGAEGIGSAGSDSTAPQAAERRIGFIDVPGHERLVHTMLAGATGIDYALLLVAADDGVMPQTREHLAVLSLLGIARGAVVVTKADRADAARLHAVQAEAAALVAGTPLADAPLCTVSAATGSGLRELRELLLRAAADAPPAAQRAAGFRLAVDRAFTLDGVGTVVTGTVHAGAVAVGDALVLTPGPAGAAPLRVRSLHAQNQAVSRAHAGQRCAVALAGVAKESIARGQWLVAPALALQTTRLDAEITLWPAEPRALRSGTVVHVHVGAAAVLGTVAVLDRGCGGGDGVAGRNGSHADAGKGGGGDDGNRAADDRDGCGGAARVAGSSGSGNAAETISPGAEAHVQLVLHAPLAAWRGDRVVLRDASASRTVAGGQVLDPFAPARYRRTPQRLAERCALELPDAAVALAALLDVAAHGVDVQRFAVAGGLLALPALPPGSVAHSGWALGSTHAQAAQQALLAALQTFHATQPDELGPDAMRLRRLALPRLPEPLFRALLVALQADGRVALRGAFVHLPEHGVRLSAADARIAQAVAPALAQAGFDGAWARDLARVAGAPEPLVRTTLARLAQRGDLHQIVKDLYLPPAAVQQLAATVRHVASAGSGDVTAAAFRDATQLGRKRAIQVLEYFDRVGLLRRVGDVHRLRGDAWGGGDGGDAAAVGAGSKDGAKNG